MKVQNLRFDDPASLMRLSVGVVFIVAVDIAGVNVHIMFGKNKGPKWVLFFRALL
jgi:hypothetical protein